MSLFAKPKEYVTASDQERRIHFRMNCTGIVEVSFFPDSRKFDATLYDLSMGGCGLKVENYADGQINSVVDMKIHIHGLVLHIDGIIRNVMGDGDRVGIEFMDVKPDQAVRIYQLMGELYDKRQGKMSLI
jgi:c-di-GMP-binding flagellar brake protein YcgR